MAKPDPGNGPKKPVEKLKLLSDETVSPTEFLTPPPRPIRFPKLRPREKTFIDLELRLAWAYLIAKLRKRV